jgi:hypothetical protein
MTPAEVLGVFDEPQLYEFWMGGNLNDSLIFHGLVFRFDKCDGHGPLPDGRLCEIEVHTREDAVLFDRPMTEWTWNEMMEELRLRGYLADSPAFEDSQVPYHLGMDFDTTGRLVWMTVSA